MDKHLKSVSSVKATDQNFIAVLLITLSKVVTTFESLHEILKCEH